MLFEIFRFVQDDKLGFVSPTVGANCVRPPNCHSEPLGEESRSARVYFVRLEILRFVQDDKFVLWDIYGTGELKCERRGRRLGAPKTNV